MTASSKTPCETQQNQLLVALSQEDMDRWQGRLELVELSLNQVLFSAGRTPEYVYFPTTAIVSLMSMTLDGASAGAALVDNDGVVGIPSLLGAEAAATDAVVQSAEYRIT